MQTARFLAVLLGAGLPLAPALHAQFISSSTYPYQDVDCSELKLTAAKGIPGGNSHNYAFLGPCKLLRSKVTTDKVAGISTGSSTSSVVEATVWVKAEVVWDKQSGLLSEGVSVEGAYAGKLAMQLKCTSDPVIYVVTCYQEAYKNGTEWEGWDRAWLKARPITYGKTTLAQAKTFSESNTASNPVPPPPPPAGDKTPRPVELKDAAKAIAAASPSVTTSASASTSESAGEPSRSSQPGPPDIEQRAGYTTIPLEARSRIALESGRVLAAILEGRELRWAILNEEGEQLRLFPSGSAALRNRAGDILVDWGDGVYRAGRVASGRLQLPPSNRRGRP